MQGKKDDMELHSPVDLANAQRPHASSIRREKSLSKSFRLSRSSRDKAGSFFRKERAGTEETIGELDKSFDVDDEDKSNDGARRGSGWHELVAQEAAKMEEAPEQAPVDSKEGSGHAPDPPGQAPDQASSGPGGDHSQEPAAPEEPGRRRLLSRLGKVMSAGKAKVFINFLCRRYGKFQGDAVMDNKDCDVAVGEEEWDEDFIEILDQLEDGDEERAIELILGEMKDVAAEKKAEP